MNSKQRIKLDSVLGKRIQKMESLNFFGQYFEEFAFGSLKKTVIAINDRLEAITSENLRIFYDNPYENKRSRYFVMVQLFSTGHQRGNFYLDNTFAFPSLLFEGDEFTGRMLATTKFETKINMSIEYDITSLRDEDFVSDIIINFLDKIYSL